MDLRAPADRSANVEGAPAWCPCRGRAVCGWASRTPTSQRRRCIERNPDHAKGAENSNASGPLLERRHASLDHGRFRRVIGTRGSPVGLFDGRVNRGDQILSVLGLADESIEVGEVFPNFRD